MNTDQKIVVFAIVMTFIGLLSVVAYNFYTGIKQRELYQECIKMNLDLVKSGKNESIWCRM